MKIRSFCNELKNERLTDLRITVARDIGFSSIYFSPIRPLKCWITP